MACPFGVLTYAPLTAAPDKLAVALKCDQCPDREKVGKVPACVAACKVGALTYGDWPTAQADRGRTIARAFFAALPAAEDYDLWLRLTWRYEVGLVDEPLVIKRGGHPDQLSGQWYAAMCDLPPVLSGKKTRSILASVMRYNFKPDEGLINGAYPDGLRVSIAGELVYPDGTIQHAGVIVGDQNGFPAHLSLSPRHFPEQWGA